MFGRLQAVELLDVWRDGYHPCEALTQQYLLHALPVRQQHMREQASVAVLAFVFEGKRYLPAADEVRELGTGIAR